MTISLSSAMQRTLKSAPDYWENAPASPSVDALKRRGLIEMRNTPGEKGVMAGFQWRISETGREVDGRGPAPMWEVTVWDHEGTIVKKIWEASDDEVADVREQFSDDPLKTIVVEERP